MPREHLSAVPTVELTETPAAAPSGGATAPPADTKGKRTIRARATHNLPTTRIKPEKQRDALSVYARLTAATRGFADSDDIAHQTETTPKTASLLHGFFIDSHWITRPRRGQYVATEPLLEYYHRINSGTPEADVRYLLADAARTSWYWATLESVLGGSGLKRSQVLYELQREAQATDHIDQLHMLLDWLEWLRLIQIVGDVVRTVGRGPAPQDRHLEEEVIVDEDERSAGDTNAPTPDPEPAEARTVDASALISFNLSVNMTAEQAAAMDPEQFKAILDMVAAHSR